MFFKFGALDVSLGSSAVVWPPKNEDRGENKKNSYMAKS